MTADILSHALRTTPICELKIHPENVRHHVNSVIDESLETNGFYKPIVASTATGHILAGNGTFGRLKESGVQEIPVYWLEGLTTEQERRILISDNRTAQLGSDDPLGLAELLGGMDDLLGTGYTSADLDAMLADGQASSFQPTDEPEATNGDSKTKKRGTSERKIKPAAEVQVRSVLYAPEIATMERALRATGEINRGRALVAVCEAYLKKKGKSADEDAGGGIFD